MAGRLEQDGESGKGGAEGLDDEREKRREEEEKREGENQEGRSETSERVVWGWEWRQRRPWRWDQGWATRGGRVVARPRVVGHDENAQPVDQYTPPRSSSRHVWLAPPRGAAALGAAPAAPLVRSLARSCQLQFPAISLLRVEEAAISLTEENVLRYRRIFSSSLSTPPTLLSFLLALFDKAS